MILVSHKKCEYVHEKYKCYKKPTYGFPNKKARFCSKHALKGMANVTSKKCDECDIIATFNLPGKSPLKCKTHADLNMIDITAIRCTAEACNTTAGFGIPGNKQTKCAQHKEENMIYNPRKRCTTKYCDLTAIYGKNTQLHCDTHKRDDEYNLIDKSCKSCKLLMIVNDKGLCGFCDPTMIKSFRLSKQIEIKKLFDNKGYEYDKYDKIIDTNCGLERPDFVFDCGDHCVVVEVDENQHIGYKHKNKYPQTAQKYKKKGFISMDKDNAPDIDQCELVRMINISQSLGMQTIFIRYNPDGFKINNKKKIVLNTTRHKMLCEWLDTLIEIKANKLDFLSVMYLYYDEFNKNDVDLHTLIEMEHKKKKSKRIIK
jgi:hypothetical protein